VIAADADHENRFAFAVLAYILLAHQLLIRGRLQARKRGPVISRFYTSISVYTLAVLLGYLVFWIITCQGTVLSADGQIGAYAVLDVLFKSLFGAWLLYTHAQVPELGTAWNFDDAVGEGRIRVGEE
jgi:bacteriorhodopsin